MTKEYLESVKGLACIMILDGATVSDAWEAAKGIHKDLVFLRIDTSNLTPEQKIDKLREYLAAASQEFFSDDQSASDV